MSQTLQAIFENGVLRPLTPLHLNESEQVSVTVNRSEIAEDSFEYLEAEADDTVSLDSVRAALAEIPGTMTADFTRERDE